MEETADGRQAVDLPEGFEDHWRDPAYVRLPCSHHYCYRKKDDPSVRHQRWSLIVRSLSDYRITTVDQFQKCVNTYQARPFNMAPFKHFMESSPAEFQRKFWDQTLPFIIEMVRETPVLLSKGVPFLVPRISRKVTYSQRALCCILANQFLCTWPKRKATQHHYPDNKFSEWFIGSSRGGARALNQATKEKIKCILHYFERFSTRDMTDSQKTFVSFQRVCAFEPLVKQSWTSCQSPIITSLHVDSEGRIEDSGNQHIHVDFANKMIGGGVLRRGCVQEEIMFCLKPELIAARVFMAEIEADEVVIVAGAERFSNYRGYASSFQWAGTHEHAKLVDDEQRFFSNILVLDATKFSGNKQGKLRQYEEKWLLRELQKAGLGFQSADFQRSAKRHTSDQPAAIATGNWGCGDFNGFHDLKCILQLLAASLAHKPVIYYTFGTRGLAATFKEFHALLVERHITVGQLSAALFELASQVSDETPQIFNLLEQILCKTDQEY